MEWLDQLGTIGKWVVIVFLTGLVAGFGKLLASWIISRRKQAALASPTSDSSPSSPPDKQQAKIVKKQAKAETKQQKKA